ncbi:YARHG domain-containing protein [Pseudalkalibacillus hwajinpoensis]|uniref:YARHG domain-containing protein n=1 Tax=Guptibacillus hwajinpoensis TaxID=208199 RepID=A0A4V5Q1Q7_9BACL|nr:YARHG domain-containing protein [Pseudalkalibacillus hwajinpoensis]TKD70708.1 YARHG domain-containing protein [Pseudalkalibacillus hwajinpoensis]
MGHCSNCGEKLHKNQEFCTGCGSKVDHQQENAPPSGVSRSGASTKRKPAIYIGLILVIGLLVGGAFYIGGKYSSQKASPVSSGQALKSDKKTPDEKSKEIASQNEEKETSKGKEEKNEESKEEKKEKVAGAKILDIESATEELNKLSIHANGRDISLGEWSIRNINGKLIIQADAIPSDNLDRIFTLYDQNNLTPIKKWSVEVLHVVHELEKQLQLDWSISVGNTCVPQYPVTLPSAVLSGYYGSCGYSIPILEAYDWNDITLFVDENVMSDYATQDFEYTEPFSFYILPNSDVIKLHESDLSWFSEDELRLARNEIFARHGYVFKSDELERYFSDQSWYYPDPYYDGSLSSIEDYNVKLIEKMEEQYK